jgi:hypothetical protein
MKIFVMFYSGNWNDEIDVDGFILLNKTQVKYVTGFLKNFKDPISISLGFGEDIEYENGKELLDEISFQEITIDECETIIKFFGNSNDFGDNLMLSIKQNAEEKGLKFEFKK